MDEGVGGLFKGIGRGIIGIPTKPVTAALDFVHNTTEGICNTTTYFEREEAVRSRTPRAFKDACLTDYDERAALGQEFLYSIDNNYYYNKKEPYENHFHLEDVDLTILLTKTQLLSVTNSTMQVQWGQLYSDLFQCGLSRDGKTLSIRLHIAAQQQLSGWFFSTVVTERTISSEDTETLQQLRDALQGKLQQEQSDM